MKTTSLARRIQTIILTAICIFAPLTANTALMPHHAYAATDTYPAPWAPPTAHDTILDTWREWNRNCTSYVAWMLHSVNKFEMPFNDDASNWGSDATARGYTVDMHPAIGSIYWTSSPQHVAYVEAISTDGTTVTTEDYNAAYTYVWGEHATVATNSASGYIHFKDIPTDTDGDGVPDSSDWCPIVAGNPVNNGCPNDVIQVSGDVNGDGKKDVVDISRNTDNSPVISWFPSTSTATTASLADPQSGGVSLPAPGWNVDHLKWTVGDFNGDGKDDLAVVSGSATDPPSMYILLSNGSGFNAPQLVKQPNPAYWLWPRLEFLAGDFDGDGKSDIIAISRGSDNAPGISWFKSTSTGTTASLADPLSTGVSLPAPSWNVDNLKSTVGDFNGDHKADLFMMSGSQTNGPSMYILQSTGTSFNSPVLVKQPNPAYWQWPRLTVMAGDLNGDGKSDIIYESRNLDNTASFGWLQSTSTSTTPSLADGVALQSPGANWLVSNLKLAIIDVNGDGKADLFACSGSATDPPVLYIFLAGASGTLNNPTLVYQPNPAYWQWPRLQF